MKYLCKFPIFESKNEWQFEFKSNYRGDNVNQYQDILNNEFDQYTIEDLNVFLITKYNNDIIGICEFGIYETHIWISWIWSKIKHIGIASSMIEKILEYYPNTNELKCLVRKNNIPSLNMFFKLGFKIEQEFTKNNINWINLYLKII